MLRVLLRVRVMLPVRVMCRGRVGRVRVRFMLRAILRVRFMLRVIRYAYG